MGIQYSIFNVGAERDCFEFNQRYRVQYKPYYTATTTRLTFIFGLRSTITVGEGAQVRPCVTFFNVSGNPTKDYRTHYRALSRMSR